MEVQEAEAREVAAADPVASPAEHPRAEELPRPCGGSARWILAQFDAVDAEYRRPPALARPQAGRGRVPG